MQRRRLTGLDAADWASSASCAAASVRMSTASTVPMEASLAISETPLPVCRASMTCQHSGVSSLPGKAQRSPQHCIKTACHHSATKCSDFLAPTILHGSSDVM